MNLFEGLSAAKLFKRSDDFEKLDKLPVGEHEVEIDSIKEVMSKDYGPFIVAEYTVTAGGPAKIGERYCWKQNLRDRAKYLPRLLEFVLAAMGADEVRDPAHFAKCKESADVAWRAALDQGYLNHARIRVRTVQGTKIVFHNFSAK